MSDDDKVLITPEEAESLLHEDSDTVHNFIQRGPIFLGCDFERAHAIERFQAAKSIEIGGEGCKAMKHPLAVFDKDGKLSFFEADMAKVEAFEAARRTIASTECTGEQR